MNANQQFLAQCEQEELHLSGAIQPHGTLLAADDTGLISHVAANAQSVLGIAAQELLGQSLSAELSSLAQALRTEPGSRRTGALSPLPGCTRMQVMLSRNPGGSVIAELMPLSAADREYSTEQTVFAPMSPRNAEEMAALDTALVESVADLTGFARVMYYSFREDGDGEVIAEVCRGGAYGSYLGLRYPASDIPQIARQLYLKNPWRMIPCAAAPPIAILGTTADSKLDLTYSDLRSVSPIHQAYLANMGVVASLSFPILQGGKLVGLIAAHHDQVQSLPYKVLQLCAAQVTHHAQTAFQYAVQQKLRRQDKIVTRTLHLRPFLASLDTLESHWESVGAELISDFGADSVQLRHPRLQLSAGTDLDEAARDALEAWFSEQRKRGVAHCDNLRLAGSAVTGDQVAGVLALAADTRDGQLELYFTRRELIHDVAWGGRPDKPEENTSGGLTIAPRRSFEKWVEKRFGYCRPWGSEERQLALSLRALITNELEPDLGNQLD